MGPRLSGAYGPMLGALPMAASARKRKTSWLALGTSVTTKCPSRPGAGPYWRTTSV